MQRTVTVLVAIVLLALAAPCQAVLVFQNGFEDPDLSTSPPFVMQISATGIIPSVVGSPFTVGPVAVDIVNNAYGAAQAPPDQLGPSIEGDQFLDLNGSPGPGTIFTTIATVIGQAYSLSFYYANNIFLAPTDPPFPPGEPKALVTVVGGLTLISDTISHTTSAPNVPDWTHYVKTFVADNTSTVLTIATDPPVVRFAGMLLDDFTVTAVPEGSAFAFGGIVCGVMSLGYGLRRVFRRKEWAKA